MESQSLSLKPVESEGGISQRRELSQAVYPGVIDLTPDLRAELLDPESWGKILSLYARTIKLAVALIDTDGLLVGICHNPQPAWKLARAARPSPPGGCLFCLETDLHCRAAATSLRTGAVALARDRTGFEHVALSIALGDRHLGTLLAGQAPGDDPEPVSLERLAREFGVSPQQFWDAARAQTPMSRATLTVFGELLGTLGQTFLRDRYGVILERKRAQEIQDLNLRLTASNSTLNLKVAEVDQAYDDLRNVLDSAEISTIFLAEDFRVRSFAPADGGLIRLEPCDIGRHITELADRFVEAGLADPIAQVVMAVSNGAYREYPVRQEPDSAGIYRKQYLMRVLPYREGEHLSAGVVMAFVDVTQVREAERRARNAQLYAENIVITVRHPLLVLDDKLCVQSANPAFYEKFQVSAVETQGRTLYELGEGQWDIPELRRLLDELLLSNQFVRDFEIEQSFPHLGPRIMLLNVRRMETGSLLLLSMEDITEQKLLDKSLLRLNQNLRDFSQAASHDLQEPLRMVKSYTELLAREYKGKLDQQAEQFIAYTVKGASQLETLLQGLRQYWLVNEPMQKSEAIDCGRILDESIQALQIPIEESGALVTRDSMPTLVAEQVSLAMLFQNLVSNAIKYRRPGERPSVHISAEKEPDAWRFSVKDKGIGIEAQHLEDIFAPFKRLNKKDYPGSGIGLALCHRIVERYGGRLWVESDVGRGSTFFFTIPFTVGQN